MDTHRVQPPADATAVHDERKWLEERHRDESYRLRTLTDRLVEQHKEDLRLRRRYAGWLLGVLIGEVAFSFVLLLLLGYQRIRLEQWEVTALVVGVFGQTAAIVQLIVKGLFQDTLSQLIQLMPRL